MRSREPGDASCGSAGRGLALASARIFIKAVAKKIFAPGFDPAAWVSLVEARREQILKANTVEEFEGEVRDLLAQLKISHITFFHRSLLKIPPQYAIGATFQRE